MQTKKILKFSKLCDAASKYRSTGKTIVLCHGAFDLMHAGHIRHLQRASQLGDVLIVTVTSDACVNKGPGRPVFNEHLRAESLAALECVHFVAINDQPTAINIIDLIKPEFYVKGSDYKSVESDVTGNILREKKAVEANNGRIHFTDEITFSSSHLLNGYFDVFPQETKEYLDKITKKYQSNDIIGMVKSISHLNLLVLGDAIVDEYHYTNALGQTGKGNVLAVKYESKEQFAGGALAVANHLSNFTHKVSLVTGLGNQVTHEDFIRSKLLKNVDVQFFYRNDAPTVVKRRYVDRDLAKLFEIYFYNENPLPAETENAIGNWLSKNIEKFDAVIVPDFGNGFITPKIIETMTSQSRLLAVNTQINSGNRGYHAINQYPHVDFVSLNEPELRLATHNKHDSLSLLAQHIADKVGAKWVAVTLGTKGLLFLDVKTGETYQIPALSTKVVDRIGAGDAFLSIAGLCIAGRLPLEVALFVGSAAAALEVQTVCNREPVSQISLFKFITTLLK